MILILGGTTEGRKAVQVVESAGKPYYSTVGSEQAIEAAHAIRLTGGMEEEEMARFCREKEISLLVDAAHPFAIRLHRTLAKVSSRLRIPVVRLERQYPERDKRLIWCADYAAAIDRLRADGIRNLLALTGVKTIAKLRPYWEQTPCWFRILDRKESLSLAESDGFPKERLVFFHEGEDEKRLLERLHPDAVLTKESGESGYFREKVEAAGACGIPVYVIQRPLLPDSFTFVQGVEGLRKTIERLAPGFFPLRSGFTTGTCATAAAKAALVALLSRREQTASCITLPSGEKITLPVAATEWVDNAALCTVVKDSGDDPDVTNGTDVCVTVAYAKQRVREQIDGSQDRSCAFTSESFPYLTLDGGIGIGRVTKEGLEQAVGQAAINRVPRQMIFAAVADVCEKANVSEPLHITVWMPEGEALAKRTFNPKLGIEGGLSVLGTSGILEPMSEQAIVATIETEIRQLHAVGEEKILVTPGNYGQAYASEYLKLDLTKSVKSSNYIGDTIDLAISYGMKDFLLVGNIGKLVKLAAGIFNTHSKVADGRGEIFAVHAAMAGAEAKVVQEIYDCINTDRMLDVLEREGLREVVMQSILAAIEKHVAGRVGDTMRFGVIVFSEKYGYLGQTSDAERELNKWYIL